MAAGSDNAAAENSFWAAAAAPGSIFERSDAAFGNEAAAEDILLPNWPITPDAVPEIFAVSPVILC